MIWGRHMRAAACRNLEKEGALAPVLLVENDVSFHVIGMDWDDEAGKVAVLKATLAKARVHRPLALCLIVDAYIRQNPIPGEPRPSENPLAREAIVVTEVDREGVTVWQRVYSRDDGGKIRWEPWETFVGLSESWMIDLMKRALI